MRNLLLAGAALTALICYDSARAADLSVPAPVYKAPQVLPAFSWTGIYFGFNAGYGWSPFSDQLQDLSNGGFPFRGLSPKGGFGGGQIGANWQVPNTPLVLGVEADIQGGNIKDSQTWALATSTSEINSFGTVRARAGYAYDHFLFYGTGGLAYGHVNNSEVGGNVYSISREATGWVAGGGIEWAFASHWSVKGEYQYINLGQNVPATAGGTPLTTFPGVIVHDDEFSTVRVGVNYKFW
jgi:outer membrane immunogenic protein